MIMLNMFSWAVKVKNVFAELEILTVMAPAHHVQYLHHSKPLPMQQVKRLNYNSAEYDHFFIKVKAGFLSCV